MFYFTPCGRFCTSSFYVLGDGAFNLLPLGDPVLDETLAEVHDKNMFDEHLGLKMEAMESAAARQSMGEENVTVSTSVSGVNVSTSTSTSQLHTKTELTTSSSKSTTGDGKSHYQDIVLITQSTDMIYE